MSRENTNQENQIAVIIFFLIILILGFGFNFLTIDSKVLPKNQDVLTGEWNRQFEKLLSDSSPLTKEAISLWSAFEYTIFSTGRKGVLIGSDGWLYSDEEFNKAPNFEAEIQEKVQYIVDVKKTLKDKGIRLLVVPIPAKARVYPEFLGRYLIPDYWKPVYSAFLASLEQKGVWAVDTLTALESAKKEGAVFIKTDTHWTPLGAQAVAKSIQSVTKSLSLTRVQTTRLESIRKEYSGDLAKFIPLGRYGAIKTEFLEVPRVEISSSSSGLLGDTPIEVALVGTSYSANTNFGFDDELKSVLGLDVLNLALEGKGAVIPMQMFLKTLPQPLPKLVIWELPERFLPIVSLN
jgi:alginate O-acetyltransferase complex protein AlgJ